MTNATKEPTLAGVQALEERLAGLEQRAAGLEKKDTDLTKSITDIHAAGSGDKKHLGSLTKQRREGREERADLVEAIEVLQDQIALDREAASRTAAVERLAEIVAAYTPLIAQYEAGVARLGDAATQYAEASVTMHETFGALAKMRAERGALLDRFSGVTAANLPPSPIVAPALHGGVGRAVETVAINFADHAHTAMAREKDEHGLRSRRSYKEASGTPGYGIIRTAGLAPWPALTAAQEAILDGRRRDAEAAQRDSTRFATEGERSLVRRGV